MTPPRINYPPITRPGFIPFDNPKSSHWGWVALALTFIFTVLIAVGTNIALVSKAQENQLLKAEVATLREKIERSTTFRLDEFTDEEVRREFLHRVRKATRPYTNPE